MTGVLFPEFEDSDRYETAGRRIIEINMKKQLFDDGGSKEGCPSYSHFIARMYLEVYLLLEKNSLPTISGLEECIKKQYTWLYQMTPPTGKTLQIGDSYALDAERDIATAASVMELNLPNERCSVLFEESRFAALRNERFDVFIDAMDRTQGHQHFGRPHITAFCEKKPLLIDTGCCVYDRKDFRNFLMSAEAHNTILITSPDTGAILSDSTNTSIDVTGFDMVGENQQIVLETKGEGFAWKRMMSIEGKRLKIYDSVNSDTPLVCTLMLHFAPTKATLVSSCEAALFLKDKDIKITLDSGSEGFKMEVHPAMDDQNGFFYSTVLSTKAEGTRVEFCILLE